MREVLGLVLPYVLYGTVFFFATIALASAGSVHDAFEEKKSHSYRKTTQTTFVFPEHEHRMYMEKLKKRRLRRQRFLEHIGL